MSMNNGAVLYLGWPSENGFGHCFTDNVLKYSGIPQEIQIYLSYEAFKSFKRSRELSISDKVIEFEWLYIIRNRLKLTWQNQYWHIDF